MFQNTRQDMANDDWGWVKYKRTHIASREDGRKLYEGIFRASNDPYKYTETTILFWARHPKKAMSYICQSGTDPRDFHDQIVN